MDAASCGPSSALQNLNKHAQRDTSLQHQRLHPNGPQQQGLHQFRQGNQIDSNLQNDFKQFNQSNQGHDFASSFMQQMNRPQFNQQIRNSPGIQQNQQGWVNDFSNLSIERQKSQQNQNQQQQNNWHQQFMQQSGPQQHQPILDQQQPQQIHHTQSQYHPNYSMGNFQNRLTMNALPQYNQQSEHQEIHKLQNQHQQFENEFDLLEKELSQQENQQADITIDNSTDLDKEKFAQTAKLVEDSMNQLNTQDSNMNAKFQNSDFLKLMNSISNKKVELEGDKLINSENKQDIREDGIPQTTLNQQQHSGTAEEIQGNENVTNSRLNQNLNNIDYHQPIHNNPSVDLDDWSFDSIPNHPQPQQHQPRKHRQQPQQPQQQKLPDPLSHIADDALEGILDPLTAARIISGGQVTQKDWTDVEGQDDWLTSDEFPGLNSRPHVPWRKHQVVYNDDNEEFGL
ncbi:hypothetical protein KGF54_000516 [Candida jiufengensis]|uniref:uncharacterized protein n=1 Tax=Candida jiufengensis TaxID=497108 RepID=UPI00222479D0|nr:uncharacterized protein KGF54_000516 [Candida jiufengensis]KAI5956898.1 hypothetical protein KGF54_000516 [Candida jiufengensis]